jgi:glycosidase
VAVGTSALPLPEGWQTGAFMQVFVRSYQDSDGDGIGDLKGLISRLDYLQDLGIRGLWLMPVHPSQDRDHGYAVKEYRNVESQYGSLADLDALVTAAAARGIGVILDYVVNHSAADHPAFINARAAKDNAYRNWYLWQDTAPLNWNVFGSYPWRQDPTGWYYAPFWSQMPDWNLRLPAVEAFHHDNLRFWLNRGVAGFRFDAVGLLIENGPNAFNNQPESRSFMQRIQGVLQAYQRRYMVCEAPDDSQGYAVACGSAFAFDLNGRILGAVRGQAADIAAVSRYFVTAAPGTATFLANHDLFAGDRVWNQLGGDPTLMKLAAGTYLLLPGTPFVYYGEEIGMAAAANINDDGRLRTPMSWSSNSLHAGFSTTSPYRSVSSNVATNNVQAQQAQADSLLAFYKAMIKLRNTRLSIARGSYDKPFVQGSVMGYTRTLGQERSLVLVNYGSQAARITLTDLPAAAVLNTLWPQGLATTSANAGQVELDIPAKSLRVLDVR